MIKAVTVGKRAPRPRPARKRVPSKMRKLGARPLPIIITEKLSRLPMMTLRRPILSASVPATRAPSSIPNRVMEAARPTRPGVRPQLASPSNAWRDGAVDDQVIAVEQDQQTAKSDDDIRAANVFLDNSEILYGQFSLPIHLSTRSTLLPAAGPRRSMYKSSWIVA